MKNKVYIIFVFSFLTIIGFIFTPKQDALKKQLEKEGVYVIGKLITVKGMKGGQNSTFEFLFQNKYWQDDDYKVIGEKYIGKRFLVRVLPSKPQINEIFPEYPVKDSIIHQPNEGWNKIPVEIIQQKKQ